MPTVARRPICPDPFQMFRHIVLTAAALTAIITAPTIALEAQSDAEIVQAIIRECRAIYHQGGRPCACPDDHARNGSLCGKRSAYSRPGLGSGSTICGTATPPSSWRRGCIQKVVQERLGHSSITITLLFACQRWQASAVAKLGGAYGESW
jgi:hypothetical protein